MHIKKKNTLPIIVLYHCTLFHNCFASHIEIVEEILSFCNNNAHPYVAILDQDAKVTSSFMKSSLNDIRIKSFVREEHLSMTLDTMDTLIVQKNSKSPQFDDILKMITTRKRQKSILVVMESEVDDFKVNMTTFAYFIIYITFNITNVYLKYIWI